MITQYQGLHKLLGDWAFGKHAHVSPCLFPNFAENDIFVNFDWMRFYAQNVGANITDFETMIFDVIGGERFIPHLSNGFVDCSEPLPVCVSDIHKQIYKQADRFYTRKYQNATGAYVLAEVVDGRVETFELEFQGNACREYFPANNLIPSVDLLVYMIGYFPTGRWSRNDSTCELARSILNIDDVIRATADELFFGVNEAHIHLKVAKKRGMKGKGVMFGSENSREKKVVIYDAEDLYEREATRVEVRSGRERLDCMCQKYVNAWRNHRETYMALESLQDKQDELIRYNKELITICLDTIFSRKTLTFFVPSSTKHHATSATREVCPFWSRVVENLGEFNFKPVYFQRKKSLSRTVLHHISHVSGSLVALDEHCGNEFVHAYVDTLIDIRKNGVGCTAYDGTRYIDLVGCESLSPVEFVKRLQPSLQRQIKGGKLLGRMLGKVVVPSKEFTATAAHRCEPTEILALTVENDNAS